MKQYVEIEDLQAWKKGASEYLSLYGSEPERSIYMLSISKFEQSGFALVNRSYRFNNTGSVMSQFYISPENQSQGLGRVLANHIFAEHPGEWEVCVISANTIGFQFWESVISTYTKGRYSVQSKADYNGHGFTFESA